MVKVQISQTVNINSITVTGHAESAEYGKDLVCAAVSAIILGAAHAFNELEPTSVDIKIGSGKTSLEIINLSEKINWMLATIIKQLELIATNYPEFVKIIWRKKND